MTGIRRSIVGCAVAMLVATSGHALVEAGQTESRPKTGTPALQRAYDAAYSLDYDTAIGIARQAVADTPNDPDAHRTLAAILQIDILYKRGAITVDQYLGGVTKSLGAQGKVPPELDTEFHRELDASIRLSEAELANSPRDLDAKYSVAAAYGLQASYVAAVEGSTMAAFRSAKRAYDNAEDVLERQPDRAEAAVIVGTYRYIVSTLGLTTRWIAYMAGFGGGKEKGIALIESAFDRPNARVEAGTALVLIYTREGRHEDVVRVLRRLAETYPRNRIFVLERGAAAIRAGRPADAESILTGGLQEFELDPRVKMPGERALWCYKRGAARVALHNAGDAETDLRTALDSQPADWVRGRIHLELGKAHDLLGQRPAALAEYRQARTIADAANDAIGSAAAVRFEHQPFGRDKP